MQELHRYTIDLICTDPAWWRFNVEMICGALDDEGHQIGFVTASSRIAEVGANLKSAPPRTQVATTLRLETPMCVAAKLIVHIIPHSMPAERQVAEVNPLELHLAIYCDDQLLRNEEQLVNPWSGASMTLQFKA